MQGRGCCKRNRETINDKNLKYEIETIVMKAKKRRRCKKLSMIRISSMRLKQCCQVDTSEYQSCPINDKNLKYEIETGKAPNHESKEKIYQ